MISLYVVGSPTHVVMKPLFALLVAAVVVGTVPIGAAAVASPDASPADLGTGPGPAQTADNETVTGTPTSNTTDSNTTESATTDGNTTGDTDTATNGSGVEPGAQLAGVVAVQRTEVESEVGSRAFGQRVAAAASNDSKAAIVSGEVNDSRERLADLRDRLDELKTAREAGNITEGRYRAETAQASAEINAIERRLEQSNETAASLPADVRAANGINASNIQRLRTEARNLSGPEVAEIARSIGGDRSGRGLGDNVGPPGQSGEASGPGGPPDDADRGPPEDRGNGSGGDGAASDRGAGNGPDGEGAPENAPDRGNNQRGSGDGGSPQESEANRTDRENGEGNGSGSSDGGDGGPDSNPGNGGGDGNGNQNGGGNGNQNGNGPDGGPPNDSPDSDT